jgi:succinate dehydrogenase / fumarate reductase cytochrome b subunit
MSWFGKYLRSSVGSKHIMALTGILLVGFILEHMIGNLLIFAGPEALNEYAYGLKHLFHGIPVWLARGGLLLAALLHILRGLSLAAQNRRARPVKYAVYKPVRSSFYARWMASTGTLLLVFIIFHLLHFTLGVITPETFNGHDALGHHDVFRMVVLGFQNPALAISYMVAMAILCMHLAHGASSLFQSLGLRHPKYDPILDKVGPVVGLTVFIGNTAMPVAVLVGLIKLPGA